MIVVPLVCGAGIGVAVWLMIRAVAMPHPNLAAALEDLHRPRARHLLAPAAPRTRWTPEMWGWRVTAVAAAAGFQTAPTLLADLELVGRSWDRHVLDKILAAAYGFALPLIVAVLLALMGVAVPVGLILVAALGLLAAGFVIPNLVLRAQVNERRQSFEHAFSLYLELVALVLSGGGGMETALTHAADAGDGWSFQQLRAALAGARLTGKTPWEAFDELGGRLRLPALSDLAASVSLAGEQGAKVRASLGAKAASLREHRVRDAEADAEAASERMTVPLVLLLIGFVIFIGYPAMQRVLTSL